MSKPILIHSNHAAVHAGRQTLTPKDSRFIRDIISNWESGSWVTMEPQCYGDRIQGIAPQRTPSTIRKGTATSCFRTKQTAAKSTGGKAPDVQARLIQKANRGYQPLGH